MKAIDSFILEKLKLDKNIVISKWDSLELDESISPKICKTIEELKNINSDLFNGKIINFIKEKGSNKNLPYYVWEFNGYKDKNSDKLQKAFDLYMWNTYKISNTDNARLTNEIGNNCIIYANRFEKEDITLFNIYPDKINDKTYTILQ